MDKPTRAGRQCAGCTEWITPHPRERNTRKWCSDRCRTATYYRNNPDKAQEQRTKNRERKRKRTAQRGPIRYELICQFCGEGYSTRQKSSKYCGRKCSYLGYHRESYTVKRYWRDCQFCGDRFEAARVNKVYCSKDCTSRSWADRNRKPKKPRRWKPKSRVPKRYIRRCAGCSDLFTAVQVTGRYCSTACASRVKSMVSGDRRRARTQGVGFTRVERLHVYERDGWVCQLCFRPTSREFSHDDPWSPTLDHIVALSRGGAHNIGNAQLAHHICNSIKSDGDFDPTVLARFELDLAA